MKKIILPVFLAALMLMSACSQNKPAEPQPAPAEGSQIEYINTFNDDSEETLRINAFNVAVVTKAYPLETTDNTLKVIIDHLHTLHSVVVLLELQPYSCFSDSDNRSLIIPQFNCFPQSFPPVP